MVGFVPQGALRDPGLRYGTPLALARLSPGERSQCGVAAGTAGLDELMASILISVQHLDLGGMEKMVTELALGLRRRGHDVCVVGVYGGGAYVKRLEAEGVSVYAGLAGSKRDPRVLPRLWRICRRHRVECAIAAMGGNMHTPTITMLVCQALRIPCVRWVHCTPGKPLSRVARLLQRWMTGTGSKVVALTANHARSLNRGWGIPESQLAVVWNGQSLPERAAPKLRGEVRCELGLSEEEFVVGMVAGFRPVKRHEILIRAFELVLREVPNARLLLVGDGETRSEAERLVGELSLASRVIFLGPRSDAARFYACMDVHALCSYPAETFPLVVTEAMAAGVVQVAPAVGGIPELISEGRTGVLVPPESPAALAEAIISLAGDADRRERMTEAAHQFAMEHFSLETMVDGFFGVMQGVLGETGATGKLSANPSMDR